MRFRIASVLMPLFIAACTENRTDAVEQASASAIVPQSPQTPLSSQSPKPSSTLRGTLREQIPVEPYVYVRLETADGEIWAAVNEAPLALGDSITVYNAFPMDQFASQTLNRTFERIYFGSLEPSSDAAIASSGELSASSTGTPTTPDAAIGPIAPAQGASARTIGDLWRDKEQLASTTVSVRGVVVKYNAAVMGKNWLHLQDGTGNAAQGTHDIVVTSMDPAAVGDTVTIRGIVRTNQDLGAGYVYSLLVEDASIVSH